MRGADASRYSRRTASKSRCEICKQTGVSQSALSKFVLGHRGIDVEAMDAVDCSLGFVIISRPSIRQAKNRKAP